MRSLLNQVLPGFFPVNSIHSVGRGQESEVRNPMSDIRLLTPASLPFRNTRFFEGHDQELYGELPSGKLRLG